MNKTDEYMLHSSILEKSSTLLDFSLLTKISSNINSIISMITFYCNIKNLKLYFKFAHVDINRFLCKKFIYFL